MKPMHIPFVILFAASFHALQVFSQDTITYNREYRDASGNIYLLGQSTRQRLEQPPFDAWFHTMYASYAVDSVTANQLKPLLTGRRFKIFMGTWCGDSRREVPRIYKLLDYCGIPASQVELINVDFHDSAYKQSPTHEERGLDIHRVPDLLVYGNDREIGRVVESPVISWEKDLLAILQGHAYSPRYKGVPLLATLLRTSNLQHLDLQQVTARLRPLVQNRFELQSYGQILMSLKEIEKALLVFRLNALLFPNEPAVWARLAALEREQ